MYSIRAAAVGAVPELDKQLPHLLKQGVEAATRVSTRLPDAVTEPGCARKGESWANKA